MFTRQIKDGIGETIPYTDNVKLSNECDFIRLVAPNHQSMFEFNPAKNGSKTKQIPLTNKMISFDKNSFCSKQLLTNLEDEIFLKGVVL